MERQELRIRNYVKRGKRREEREEKRREEKRGKRSTKGKLRF
jgi:hypothetical protein